MKWFILVLLFSDSAVEIPYPYPTEAECKAEGEKQKQNVYAIPLCVEVYYNPLTEHRTRSPFMRGRNND